MTDRIIYITRVQRLAAQARVELDQLRGLPSRPEVVALANAKDAEPEPVHEAMNDGQTRRSRDAEIRIATIDEVTREVAIDNYTELTFDLLAALNRQRTRVGLPEFTDSDCTAFMDEGWRRTQAADAALAAQRAEAIARIEEAAQRPLGMCSPDLDQAQRDQRAAEEAHDD